jgi:hypothetical protein
MTGIGSWKRSANGSGRKACQFRLGADRKDGHCPDTYGHYIGNGRCLAEKVKEGA